MSEAKALAIKVTTVILIAAIYLGGAFGISFGEREHLYSVGWFLALWFPYFFGFPILGRMLYRWIFRLVDIRKSQTERAERTIDVKPESLVEPYENYRLTIQADAAVERYIGKWIRIDGSLDDMYFLGTSLMVWVKEGKSPPEESSGRHLRVALTFRDTKSIHKIIELSHGDSISAVGRIDSIGRRQLSLDDCALADT